MTEQEVDRAKATELVRLVLLENLRWEMAAAAEGAIITSETEAAVINSDVVCRELATSPTLADMGEVVANHPPETAIIGAIRTRLLLQTVLDACPDDVLKDQKLSGLFKFKDILGSLAHGS